MAYEIEIPGVKVLGDEDFGKKIIKEIKTKNIDKKPKGDLSGNIIFYCFNLDTIDINYVKKISNEHLHKDDLFIGITKFSSSNKNFKTQLENLKDLFNSIILVDINKIRKNLKLDSYLINNLVNFILELSYSYTTPGLVGFDFGDLKDILENGKFSTISFVEPINENEFKEIYNLTLKNLFSELELTKNLKILITLIGGENIHYNNICSLLESFEKELDLNLKNNNIEIVYSARLEKELDKKIKVYIIFSQIKI